MGADGHTDTLIAVFHTPVRGEVNRKKNTDCWTSNQDA